MSGASVLLLMEPAPDPRAAQVFSEWTELDAIQRRPVPCDTPERRLAAAVLLDGVRAAQGRIECSTGRVGSRAREEQVADARAWLRLSRDVLFSAAWLCDQLGIDHAALLTRMTRS